MKIFIDYFKDQGDFAQRLATRIKTRIPNAEVIPYWATRKWQTKEVNEADSEVIDLLRESAIIIPIITPSYLLSIDGIISDTFSDLLEEKEKFIFPVILDTCVGFSKSWIVKCEVFPKQGALNHLEENQKQEVISNLLQAIESTSLTKSSSQEAGLNQIHSNEKMIFISYDHEDTDFAELIKLELEKHKIVGWLDSKRLKIGQEWREEIDNGISKSFAVIAIMSPEAYKSEYVTYEWAFARGRGKKILPIMLKQTPLHARLETLQYLDFTNRAARPWDKLIESIKELLQ